MSLIENVGETSERRSLWIRISPSSSVGLVFVEIIMIVLMG